MEKAALLSRLNKLIPGLILEKGNFGRSERLVLWVESASILKIAEELRTDPELKLDWVENLSAMQMDDILVVTWFLRSHELSDVELILRATVVPEKADAWSEIPSTRAIWPSAAPFEREIRELFGISFVRGDAVDSADRLAPGWVGFPLRKDYVFPTEFGGVRHVVRGAVSARPDELPSDEEGKRVRDPLAAFRRRREGPSAHL